MNNHPVNLAVRFLLETAALLIFGRWGWMQSEGLVSVALSILLPAIAAAIWGMFRVPGDPGAALVPVSGIIRLLIEAVFFATALWMLKDMQADKEFWVMLVILLLHYAVSYDRIIWMLTIKKI